MTSTNWETNQPVFISDLQSALIDDNCRRAYWWHRHEQEYGIFNREEETFQQMLRATKKDIRELASLDDLSRDNIEDIVVDMLGRLNDDDRRDIRVMQALYRRLGWFAAYAFFIEPETRKFYKKVKIPESILVEFDNLFLSVDLDLLLKHSVTGELIYRDLMPGPEFAGQKWYEHHRYTARPQIVMAAISKELQRPVAAAQIMRMSLGSHRLVGRNFFHPYVYGYYNISSKEWSPHWQNTAAMGSPWELRPIWEYEHGLTEWVWRCGKELGHRVFSTSLNIDFDPEVANRWLAHRLHRTAIAEGVAPHCVTNPHAKSIHFPMNTDRCVDPHTGDKCPFSLACWNKINTDNGTPAKLYPKTFGVNVFSTNPAKEIINV